jgi:hypothetical protein
LESGEPLESGGTLGELFRFWKPTHPSFEKLPGFWKPDLGKT